MASKPTVTVEGTKCTIVIELDHPTRSSTGKMMLFGSTGGWKDTGATIDGAPLRLNLTMGTKLEPALV